jgi:YesN/AraC family two-component response regulator
MLRLLIVDDEVYAVEGIKIAVDWKAIGVEELYTAFNVNQAKDMLLTRDISIMLCDIEMPEESGLDLLAWMRSMKMRTEVVFLTCHTDFSYAQRAIRLQGCDYLIKPVPATELRAAITAAVAKLEGSVAVPAPEPISVDGSGTDGRELEPSLVSGAWPCSIPDMSLWTVLLKSGAIERVRYEIKAFLARLPPRERLEPAFLERFLIDFQQALFAALRSKGVSAHLIVDNASAEKMYRNAAASPDNLSRWIDFSLDFVKEQRDEVDMSHTPFGRAADFIKRNLTDDLDCGKIAAHVSLNPDYLTRLFKKETGLSVSEYVIREKLRLAADLLVSTRLSIGDIADRIGYLNPAHFSSTFKKHYKCSPQDYRAKNSKAVIKTGCS